MLFVAGFVLSLIGSLPPGLISLTVAQTAIARTFSAAIVLAGGAAFAEFFQAWFAVEMSGWFLQNPEYIKCFQWGALPVFWSLAFYLFFMAKPASGTQAPVYQYNIPAQFLKGVLVSAFNLLAIPYWFVYCGWLRAEGWWPGNDLSMTLFFASGVLSGTMIVLILYAYSGREIVRRSDTIARTANRIVAVIFFLIGLNLLFKILD